MHKINKVHFVFGLQIDFLLQAEKLKQYIMKVLAQSVDLQDQPEQLQINRRERLKKKRKLPESQGHLAVHIQVVD